VPVRCNASLVRLLFLNSSGCERFRAPRRGVIRVVVLVCGFLLVSGPQALKRLSLSLSSTCPSSSVAGRLRLSTDTWPGARRLVGPYVACHDVA